MEAASKNTQAKVPRGRPRFMTETATAAYRRLWPEVTPRHLANKRYMSRALGLLREETRYLWLCDKARMQAGEQNSFRPSILAELGRIDNDDDLRTVAEQVCKIQPKTKIAVALIRRWRLGREAKNRWLSLTIKLEQTVNEFKQSNPSLSWHDVARALETVLAEVREQEEGEQQKKEP